MLQPESIGHFLTSAEETSRVRQIKGRGTRRLGGSRGLGGWHQEKGIEKIGPTP